ncbi:hypothetical protein [Ktedonobacter racemifer]|uniref:Uncharacterized protein n=1 Tax=Ktedonobacter racemifer DSM 44963 TaxID=485913 RepID=D6TG16_KTERA|nr:hypothetical protein [Ktedonobacter racemifer]EFH88718.1 hypothetical protein Krac_10207 [Ktedonobacter racemifer DSM 44963]
MAQHSIGNTSALSNSTSQARSLYAFLWLRLTCGLTTLLGAVISFFALSWDVQWHTFVGRDRTLTPPHVLLLSGIAVCGIGALVAVIVETQWVKNNQAMQQRYTPFANRFAAPLGIYISGYAALNMAVAFPVDQYWHTLYGVDVAIWAPFHIMAIAGLGLMALGAVYTLVSVANMATNLNAFKEKDVAYVSAVVAMATSLATFNVLTAQGISPNRFIQLGFTAVNIFPMLQGLLLATLLLAIAYALPWKWAATSVVGVVALFMVISQLAVPPAITWLMQVEQLTFKSLHRSTPPQVSVLALGWPMLSIVSAILIDIAMHMARKQNLSRRWLSLMLGGAVLIGCIPFTLVNPTAILKTVANLNILGIVLTVALAFPAIYGGMKLGRNIGQTMSVSER